MHVAKEEREGEKGMIWVPGELDVAFRNQKLPEQRTALQLMIGGSARAAQ